ncbi:MAG: hypothetical protein ACKVOO_03045, partial [Burkholderiaceae bacterium]
MNLPTPLEKTLLLVCAALLALAAFGPPLEQLPHFHDFADQRPWWGMPNAGDVLSNLLFALGGLLGLMGLRRWRAGLVSQAEQSLAALSFTGLLLTALCSGYYHWQPDDAGLVVDRLGMCVAFAGLLGLAAAGRISGRAGLVLAASLLLLAPMTVWVWAESGNLLPWAVLQFGGMGLLLWLAARPALAGALPVRWAWVVVIYALAKCLELGDAAVFEATGEWVSGHTLKHIVASLAAWPVLAALAGVLKSPWKSR